MIGPSTASWLRPARHYLHKAPQDSRFLAHMLADCFRRPAAVASFDPEVMPSLSLTWLTHACFLLKLHGRLIITDPVLSARIGPRTGKLVWGPKRRIAAPIAATALPEVDLVLISHAHFDHLDLDTLPLLRARHVVCPAGVGDLLRPLLNLGTLHELGHGDGTLDISATTGVPPLRVSAFPVKHPGARWRHDTLRQCNGYLLDIAGHRLHFIGDTAWSEHFSGLPDSLLGSDIAMLPIGGYIPFERNHCTPEQALDIARILRARCVVPSQHATFRLSSEPLDEPLHRFLDAAALTGHEVRAPRPGVPMPLTDFFLSSPSPDPS